MKNIIKILFVSLLLYSCSDNTLLKPFGPEDTVAPSTITEATYTPLAGGVVISYALPQDNDLSYIKAVYTVNGEERNVISSQYNSSLTIIGLPNTDEIDIKLYSVDKSSNESKPYVITVVPNESPVILMRNSLSHKMDFGGFILNYENPSRSELTMQVYMYDEDFGMMRFHESRVTTQAKGSWQLVNLPNEDIKFSVVIKDMYGNASESYEFEDRPWKEVYCDKDLFAYVGEPLVYDKDDWYSWDGRPTVAWDDMVGAWNFASTGPGSDYPHYFCIDLGDTYPIGRMLFQQRLGDSEIFTASTPKFFDLYGVDKLPPVDRDNPLKGWTKLNIETFEVVRPSGRVPGEPVTEEDRVAAEEGIMFTIDSEFPRPETRYVRIVFKEGFQSVYAIIGELTFWAQWR